MRRTKDAFTWIIGILRKRKITFQVTGGLAAEIYGSSRKLADIDIDIPESKFPDLLSSVKPYIRFGPKRYKDKHWNLKLLTLKYKNQLIDIGSSHQKIRDFDKNKWVQINTHFHTSKLMHIFGLRVPVITEGELIDYKKTLSRRVDKYDIAHI